MAGINHIKFSQIRDVSLLPLTKNFEALMLANDGTKNVRFKLVSEEAEDLKDKDVNQQVRKAVLEGLTQPKFHDKTKSVTVSYVEDGEQRQGEHRQLDLTGEEMQAAAIQNKEMLEKFLIGSSEDQEGDKAPADKALTLEDVKTMMSAIRSFALYAKIRARSVPAKKKPINKPSSMAKPAKSVIKPSSNKVLSSSVPKPKVDKSKVDLSNVDKAKPKQKPDPVKPKNVVQKKNVVQTKVVKGTNAERKNKFMGMYLKPVSSQQKSQQRPVKPVPRPPSSKSRQRNSNF